MNKEKALKNQGLEIRGDILYRGGGLLLLNFIGKIQLNVGHVENVAFFALSSLLG